ncbi:Conserved putative membrane protein [Amycolatopsis japonica]|uniref:Conserved putative membrane protein n=1 Tax=Amycolatopsis japonica TaxID=208439 RepID=A0A075UVQ1_9PSEU|nr:hypothetical protein [Amycolatopsis japonica]AIG74310.1 Conserved putative membrane protein [Amycolatopsis japonica]
MVGAVVGFGFGNVFTLALRLGIRVWVVPLVAPAVDLTVVALLVAIRRLSEHGAAPEVQRSARRLLVLASAVTLALNVAEPLIAGEVGKASFAAVGPLLLIGWSEVGPGLLQALADLRQSVEPPADSVPLTAMAECESEMSNVVDTGLDGDLVERAKYMDARHRELRQRPISAEGLHKALGVGAERSRSLTRLVRSEWRDPLDVNSESAS